MNKKSLWQRKKTAFALSIVMIAFVLAIVIGIGLLNIGFQSRLQAVRAASDIAAKCAADSGLTKALFEMNKKLQLKPWSGSVLPQGTDETLAGFDATFSFAVTGNVNDGYVVESVGQYGWTQRKVRSALRLAGLFEKAVFTQGDLELKNGTVVDSYNNDADDGSMLIGTNSTEAGSLIMKSGVTINGDVVVGASADPDVVIDRSSDTTITGETYSLTEPYEFPPITLPDYLTKLPKLSIKTNKDGFGTISGLGKLEHINLANGQILSVNAPTTIYVSGNIILDNASQLQIADEATAPNASLTIYLDGNLECKNGGFLNNLAQDPKKLQIYGLTGCKSIGLKTDSRFYGTIYAPNADIRAYNSVEMFGSLVGKTYVQDVSAALHYDASLRDVSINDVGAYFVLSRWHEE
jgi:hypothetical protein